MCVCVSACILDWCVCVRLVRMHTVFGMQPSDQLHHCTHRANILNSPHYITHRPTLRHTVGAALGAAKRIQINLRMEPYSKIPEVKDIKEVKVYTCM